MKFIEEPFAWIGVRTWPYVQTYRQAKKWGKKVVFGGFALIALWVFVL